MVLSNGVALTRSTPALCAMNRFRLAISLDGVGEVHDQQRPFVNGRGSFTHVQRGIDWALSVGVSPFLSITVTAQSAEYIRETVAFALDRDLAFNSTSTGITPVRWHLRRCVQVISD